MQSPLQSFLRFTLGFMVFLSVSFGVTLAVNTLEHRQRLQSETAAAYQAMLGEE